MRLGIKVKAPKLLVMVMEARPMIVFPAEGKIVQLKLPQLPPMSTMVSGKPRFGPGIEFAGIDGGTGLKSWIVTSPATFSVISVVPLTGVVVPAAVTARTLSIGVHTHPTDGPSQRRLNCR